MKTEEWRPDGKAEISITTERENQALVIIRQVQSFPFDLTAKIRGMTISQQCEHTRNIGRGTCTTKHNLLAHELTNIGYTVSFLTYPFYWQAMPVNYPDYLHTLLFDMPIQYHLALRITVRGRNEVIDITWDPALDKAGFPISRFDHQINSAQLGVTPAGLPVIHSTSEARQRYIEQVKQTLPKSPAIREFYQSLNTWLNNLRTR